MIYQISSIKNKTEALPTINKGLLQARHIQAHVKEQTATEPLPDHGYLVGPANAGPFLVPITRWIE